MDEIERWARWLDGRIPAAHWHDRIYAYCERGTDGAFWAEPVNAITNFAFHLAALAALVLWLRTPGGRRPLELLLIVLVAAVGTGSLLFHTLANRWSAMADVIPIALFMLLYVGYAARRFAGFGWIATALTLAAFLAAMAAAGQMRCAGGTLCFGGSVGYFPAFGMLALFAAGLALKRHPAAASLAVAAAVFAVSLTFRTMDRAWCSLVVVPGFGTIGTHFLWHILNALLLYVLLRAAIRHGAPANARTPAIGRAA